MTTILSVALLIGICATVGVFVGYAIARGGAVIRNIFRPDRSIEWPHGVQEDDPAPAWRFPPR
jgi:hypothetical protein